MRWLGWAFSALLLAGCGCSAIAAEPAAAGISASPDGFISVAELVRLQRSGKRVHLADLRPQADHDRFHIEGAARLTPLEVRALDAWKQATVVLVGTGMAYQALIAVRAQLLSDGFADARILDGGTRQWSQAMRKGRAATALSSPRQLDLEGDAERWIVVVDKQSKWGNGALGKALRSELDNPSAVLGSLPDHVKRHASPEAASRLSNVLIVGETTQEALQLVGRIEAHLAANIFVLDGTFSDLEVEAIDRKAVASMTGSQTSSARATPCW